MFSDRISISVNSLIHNIKEKLPDYPIPFLKIKKNAIQFQGGTIKK